MMLLAAMPLASIAQTEWQRPLTAAEKLEMARQAETEAKKAVKEAKAAAKKAEKEAKREAKKQGKDAGKDAPSAHSPQQYTSEWTSPRMNKTPESSSEEARQAVEKIRHEREARKADIKESQRKYIENAVPEKEGKVVFTLDLQVPGKNARQIYETTYRFMEDIAKESNQRKEGGIMLYNENEHVIAAKYYEWLTFSNSFVSLDRTEFDYTLIAKCADEHLVMTLERISYNYEEGTPSAVKATAEKWITDRYALNKKKTKFIPGMKKFRCKTIDRKDQLFNSITQTLK